MGSGSASESSGSGTDIPRMSGVVVTEAPAQKEWRSNVENRLDTLEKNISAMRVEGIVQEANTGLIMKALDIPQETIDAIRARIHTRLGVQSPEMVGGSPPPLAPQTKKLPQGVDPLLQPSPRENTGVRRRDEPQPQPQTQPHP